MPKIQAKQIDFSSASGLPISVSDRQNLTCSVTVADNDLATASTVFHDNAVVNGIAGRFSVNVNGVSYFCGDGTKAGCPAYVSGDGGMTARTFATIVAADTVRWNQSVAGFNLAATDRIDFVFERLS